MNDFVSRGFEGRRRTPDDLVDRLPPGQYAEPGFPVLTAGPTPSVPTDEWGFRIDGMVAEPSEWTWEEFGELLFETVPCDIHCVTKWSKLGTSFGGVSLDTLFEQAEPLDAFATAFSYGGYTTNLAIEDLTDGKAWVVTEHEGEPCRASTAARPGCSCRTSTSGRARNGSPGCGSPTTTSPGSGRPTATTTAATPGRKSGTGRTEGAHLVEAAQRLDCVVDRRVDGRNLLDRHGREDLGGERAGLDDEPQALLTPPQPCGKVEERTGRAVEIVRVGQVDHQAEAAIGQQLEQLRTERVRVGLVDLAGWTTGMPPIVSIWIFGIGVIDRLRAYGASGQSCRRGRGGCRLLHEMAHQHEASAAVLSARRAPGALVANDNLNQVAILVGFNLEARIAGPVRVLDRIRAGFVGGEDDGVDVP